MNSIRDVHLSSTQICRCFSQMIMQGSQTLGKTKKSKTAQRHSAGNIDYDNLPGSQESDDIPSQPQHTFRSRSKTVGDGKCFSDLLRRI